MKERFPFLFFPSFLSFFKKEGKKRRGNGRKGNGRKGNLIEGKGRAGKGRIRFGWKGKEWIGIDCQRIRIEKEGYVVEKKMK